jgi:plasmid stabilization system protein ParE
MIVRFHSAARREFLEAADDYEQKASRLGADFISEVERILSLIKEYPDIGTPWRHETRRLPLRRFPFNRVYRHTADGILIVAVVHRRRKEYWSGRII